jgi:deoxyribose-phosphate aldolase
MGIDESRRRTARRALASLDLTELGEDCLPGHVTKLLTKAETRHGNVAAVCVWPQFVSMAAEALRNGAVAVATVINFPGGDEDVERAVADAREALRDGADEIDLVMPYRAFLRGDERLVRDMISGVRDCIPARRLLKVILETGALGETAIVRRASEIAIEAGAHFLKTSTGKTAVSATPQAARTMLGVIRESARPVGFKAAGGIRTLADAATYLALADEIMGPDWAGPSTFRIGASGLLDALLAELDKAPGGTRG